MLIFIIEGIAHLHCNKRSAAQVSGKERECPRNDIVSLSSERTYVLRTLNNSINIFRVPNWLLRVGSLRIQDAWR